MNNFFVLELTYKKDISEVEQYLDIHNTRCAS